MVESMNTQEFDGEKIIVQIICPTCQKRRDLTIEKVKIKQTNRLSTVSIPEGFVCEHHFQAFIDKNYKVRGYQKVDYQIEMETKSDQKSNDKKVDEEKAQCLAKKSDETLFKEALFEGNYVEWIPKIQPKKKQKDIMNTDKLPIDIGQIYDEFWDIIEDDNEIFHRYIEKDKERRKKRNNWLRSEIFD